MCFKNTIFVANRLTFYRFIPTTLRDPNCGIEWPRRCGVMQYFQQIPNRQWCGLLSARGACCAPTSPAGLRPFARSARRRHRAPHGGRSRRCRAARCCNPGGRSGVVERARRVRPWSHWLRHPVPRPAPAAPRQAPRPANRCDRAKAR